MEHSDSSSSVAGAAGDEITVKADVHPERASSETSTLHKVSRNCIVEKKDDEDLNITNLEDLEDN